MTNRVSPLDTRIALVRGICPCRDDPKPMALVEPAGRVDCGRRKRHQLVARRQGFRFGVFEESRAFVEDQLAAFRRLAELARAVQEGSLDIEAAITGSPFGPGTPRTAFERALAQLRGDLV